MKKVAGKVWLVGAGPSDEGLFTIKGKKVLEAAEVVVYDSLVGLGVLAMIPKQAEKIYVGKRAGKHTMRQEEINKVLLEQAERGKRVVRLKGGDPFLFGRGGEELELLVQHNIPFEVVPGVTSAIAVAAYQGIPITHRDHASSVHMITGHKRAGKSLDLPYRALVEVGGTLVFLMGIGCAGEICQGLIKAGMPKDRSAAVLSKGTSSEQRGIFATVATLEEAMKEQKVETPAVIVVGEVCKLGGKFHWVDQLPLSGERILVTRPARRNSRLHEMLQELGAEVLEVPMIRQILETEEELEKGYQGLEEADAIAFTSPTCVQLFWEGLRMTKRDVRSLARHKIAAVGKATATELECMGVFADLVSPIADGEHLAQAIGSKWRDCHKILLPGPHKRSLELAQGLEQEGKEIIFFDLYATVPEVEQEALDLPALFEQDKISYVTFCSASAVREFEQACLHVKRDGWKAVCIGQKTMQEAERAGYQVCCAKEASLASMVQCIIDEKKETKS